MQVKLERRLHGFDVSFTRLKLSIVYHRHQISMASFLASAGHAGPTPSNAYARALREGT